MANRYYYVVLKHKIRTMHCFEDKREFDEWYPMFEDIEEIVACGVPRKRAIELSDCISKESRFAELILGEK